MLILMNSQSEKDFLSHYSVHDYDVPLISVDMAIFTVQDNQLKLLIVKRAEHPALGQWALPGGFIDVQKDHQLVDTARRKLLAKTGVDTAYLEQVETIGNAQRDPRGWSVTVAYFALINAQALAPGIAVEAARWINVDTLSDISLAFDHQSIASRCLARLRNKVRYTALPTHLLPSTFTLTKLQTIFEIVLGHRVQKKSFRRRMLDSALLEPTGESQSGVTRPARLYRVNAEAQPYFFTRGFEGERKSPTSE